MMNFKVHRSFIILAAIVSALGLLGMLNMFGYPITYKIFGGVTIGHILGLSQIYIAYVMLKHYV